jgi:uncharacterized protein (TIGR02271 family)
MENIVVGMFDRADQAMAFVNDLRSRGIPSDNVSIEDQTQDSTTGTMPESRTFFQKIGDALSGRDQQTFREGIRRGHVLVSVQAPETQLDEIVALMRSHGAIDIDEHVSKWEQDGFRIQDEQNLRTTNQTRNVSGRLEQDTVRNLRDNEKEVLPVVEEQLHVGKRQVERGGVRIYSHVTERPVEEQVNLREEHVVVDRRPVDRPVTGNEPGLFQEGSFEVTERSEEAVIGKEARVVEEVVVGKTVTERTETVRDTVRRTDVDVEQISGTQRVTDEYQQYDTDFQDHYRTQFSTAGYPYDYYAPAYKYGTQLAGTDEYRGRSWDDIQPHVQRSWETQNPGTWDRVKDAIRYGWDRLTGRAASASTRSNRNI